ncbi:hypothetical protein DD237_001525 [Peronospora effusa]|uniref:Uncharacterized protein n=1 Tax=Peronospora effusa TaxID=542832 RepID=A0A425CNM1_9STRA|nr:hypothetical protein DD237_001525 [Peronospora effusa]
MKANTTLADVFAQRRGPVNRSLSGQESYDVLGVSKDAFLEVIAQSRYQWIPRKLRIKRLEKIKDGYHNLQDPKARGRDESGRSRDSSVLGNDPSSHFVLDMTSGVVVKTVVAAHAVCNIESKLIPELGFLVPYLTKLDILVKSTAISNDSTPETKTYMLKTYCEPNEMLPGLPTIR